MVVGEPKCVPLAMPLEEYPPVTPSRLKLHLAGYLLALDGDTAERGARLRCLCDGEPSGDFGNGSCGGDVPHPHVRILMRTYKQPHTHTHARTHDRHLVHL